MQYATPAAIAVTIEYSCPGRIRDTELAITARVVPRAEEEGVKSRSGRIGERVGTGMKTLCLLSYRERYGSRHNIYSVTMWNAMSAPDRTRRITAIRG